MNKPCVSHRESVALLASASLDISEAAEARRHLATCPACRGYFQELSAVCEAHAAAARTLPAATVSPRLHGRVAAVIRNGSRRGPEGLLAALGLGWVQVVTATAVLLLVATVGSVLIRRSSPVAVAITRPALPLPLPAPAAKPQTEGSRLITYRLALNRSPEEFDRLLAREAARTSAEPMNAFRLGVAWLDPGL